MHHALLHQTAMGDSQRQAESSTFSTKGQSTAVIGPPKRQETVRPEGQLPTDQSLQHSVRTAATGLITLTCLPPVSTRSLSKNDIPELMESVRSSMIETFNYTSVERSTFNHDQ
nr:uncharacterized protein LOC117681736 [Crassostrea gigas]